MAKRLTDPEVFLVIDGDDHKRKRFWARLVSNFNENLSKVIGTFDIKTQRKFAFNLFRLLDFDYTQPDPDI